MTSASNSPTNSAIVKMRSQEIITTAAVGSTAVRTSPQNVGGQTTTTTSSSALSPNWSKIQALKQRKTDLEKLLNEKNHVLQQIQRQEQQIIARNFNYINSSSGGGGSSGTAPSTLRRKIGTSFKMPNNKNGYTAKELGGSVGDMEKKVRQEILSASYKIVHDPKQTAVRRMYKADYEAAQQKLNAINHGVNLLKKQHHQRPLHLVEPNDSPVASITLNLTKTPSLVGEQQNTLKNGSTPPSSDHRSTMLDTSLSSGSNKYGSNNSVNNNYYTKERRNSIKSMQQQHSPPNRLYNEGDRSPTIHLMKPHRSDYDLSSNHLLIVTTAATTPQSELSPGGYLYESAGSDAILVNGSSSGVEGGHFYTNNAKYMTAPNRYSVVPVDSFNNSFHHSIHGQHQTRTTTTTPSSFQQQHQYDDEAATFLAQRAYSRKYQQQMYGGGDTTDSISLSPSIGVLSGHSNDPEQSAVGAGLGGYWRTYGNERIWCTVDTSSYDGSSLQQNGKLKKAHTISTTPTKSCSLGNFDVIGNVRDDGTDKISISSMNSETNRQNRQKEKQWLETSLDGPTIKTKQSSMSSSSLSPTASYHQPQHHHQHPPPLQQQQKYNYHPRKQQQQSIQTNYRDRSKLSSSQSISSATYRTPPRLEDQSYLSHSTSVLHSSSAGGGDSSDGLFTSPPAAAPSSSHPYSFHHHHHLHHHHHHPQQQQQQTAVAKQSNAEILSSPTTTITPPPPPIPPSSMLLKQQHHHQHHQHEQTAAAATSSSHPQSPHIASFNHDSSSSIRIESPKNVTVIQQAVFMPYKEITKPFEMSDFYKYSTKFRQKDKQQQPHVQVEQ